MKVYPVNAVDAAMLNSPQRASYSKISDLSSKYIDHTVDFESNNITLNGYWTGTIPADVFIIGNTNAHSGTVKLCYDHVIKFEKTFNINSHITILELLNEFEILQSENINNFTLTLASHSLISIGLIYIGKTWILPRFNKQPQKHISLRNDTGRTFTGQVTGIPTEPLRTFTAEFSRIANKELKLFENYINGVQTVIPHIIDPYYEAHEEFEPFFATVSNYGEQTKRDENGFFWNYNITWMEAK